MTDNFGKRIESLLFEKNIAKTEFAEYLGITATQLYSIINGNSMTTLTMLDTMAKRLNIPTDLLLVDYDKKFIIFAIDYYMSRLKKDQASQILNDVSKILSEEINNE